MQDSNERLQALADILGETIETLNYLQETGVRQVQIDAQVWEAFKVQPTAPRAAQAPGVQRADAAPLPALKTSLSQAARNTLSDTAEQRQTMLAMLQTNIAGCKACPHCSATHFQGRGCAFNPKVAIVNGACMAGDEPLAVGSRLEGDAGALLIKMFAAIGLTESELYITPAIKCPVVRKPDSKALQACGKHLADELRLVNPKVIVVLGPIAAQTLLARGATILTQQPGRWSAFEGGIPVTMLHHPMRMIMLGETVSKQLKLENWSALQAIRARL